MCRLNGNGLFRNASSALYNFNWEAVWTELEAKAPTL